MKEHKCYIERSDLNNGSRLEVSVYYTKGGMSAFTGQVSPRGYYLSVRPVTLGKGTVSFDLFSGCKRFILKANRYSDKQFSKAVEMAEAFENELITAVTVNEAA